MPVVAGRSEVLSPAQARRVALAAQGLLRPRRDVRVGVRQVRSMLDRLGLVQMDSINVLARAHYLPGWSRLGRYPRAALDELAYRRRELFEYWGHEASLLPVALHPLLRWRMRRAETHYETWGGIARLARDHPEYVAQVLDEVRERGPVSAADLAAEDRRRTGAWWSWAREKVALEFLFWSGAVTTYDRVNFARRYDLTERVIPPVVLARPTPTEEEAHRELLLLAARAHGVATATDLADYFRIRAPRARPRVAELVEDGRLQEVRVHGWRAPAYVVPGTVVPRRATGRALLAPFDPLVWERSRVERLFGFGYRIEVYVPAARRRHGYYVLPFLLGERLVARVDLKADRAARVLRVPAAHPEPDAPAETATALADELAELAAWLDLAGVQVGERGALARPLAAAVRVRGL